VQRHHASHEIEHNTDCMGAQWTSEECSGLPKKQKVETPDDGPCAAETCRKFEKKNICRTRDVLEIVIITFNI
jgi:hypothetical protein